MTHKKVTIQLIELTELNPRIHGPRTNDAVTVPPRVGDSGE